MRKVYSYVLIALTVIAVIALLFLAGLLVTKIPTTNDPTAIGSLVTGIVAAFGVAVALLAGFYAREQLLLGRKVALGDQLFKIDDALQKDLVVHTKLRPGGEWSRMGPDNKWREKVDGPNFPEDGPAVEGYMGRFERIQVLVEAKMIDIDTVDRLYGYRLFNIVDNPIIYQEKFVERGYGWRDFIKLWKALGALEINKNKTQPNKEILGHLRSV